MTTTSTDTKADALARVRIELARREFRHFLPYVVTENAAGYPVPAPVGYAGKGDPLQRWIDTGEYLARPAIWPHVEEMARDWSSGESIVYLKTRQIYFTWGIAAYAVFTAQQRGNVFVLSQGQDYANAVIDRCRFIYEHLPAELKMPLAKGQDNTTTLGFRGAGTIQSFPSTRDAVRSLTGRLVIADEAAFHGYAQENFRAYYPTISEPGGQLIMTSTANGPFGFFHTQFMNAYRGESGFQWRFYPWSIRPDRDAEWYERNKRAYSGFIEDFLRENPATIDEAFTTMSGSVHGFEPERHVGTPPIPYEACRLRVAGVDWGGGDPTGVVILGLGNDPVTKTERVYQYDEWSASGPVSVEDIGPFIRRYRDRAPLMSVECDPSQGVAIRTLARQFGLPARPAKNTRQQGIERIEWLLKNNLLLIDPNCTRSIEEFYGYRWRQSLDPNTRERYATTTPVDHHADLMDARRYAALQLTRFMQAGATLSTTTGKPFAKKAV